MECHIGVLRFVVDSCTQQESQSPARNLDSWCAYVCMYVHKEGGGGLGAKNQRSETMG